MFTRQTPKVFAQIASRFAVLYNLINLYKLGERGEKKFLFIYL